MTKATKLPDGQTALYRAYDSDGVLLYVGITDDPKRRLTREHRKYSPWFSDAATALVRIFPSRKIALMSEAMAITREEPRWLPEFDARLIDTAFVEPAPIREYAITFDRGGVFD